MITLELRTYVTHPLHPMVKTLRIELELEHPPPLGIYINMGEVNYPLRSLSWFHDEKRYVSAQQFALSETDDYLEELSNLRRMGWKDVEMAS